MKIVHHFIQLLAMALIIFILYHIKMDEAVLSYILPITIIGVIGILAFAFMTFKRRGWLVIVAVLISTLSMTQPAWAAEKLLPCAHKGQSALERLSQAKTNAELAKALGELAQEKAGGNFRENDFEDDLTQACVIVNCINAAVELKGQTMDCEADYDPQMRQNAHYIVENVSHMNFTSSRRDAEGGWFFDSWIEEEIEKKGTDEQKRALEKVKGQDVKDAIDARRVAKEYLEHCACVDKKKEKNCRTIAQTVAKNSQDCWVCSIVEALLLSTQKIAKVAYALLAQFSLGLLGVMFLFWLAIKVLHLIGTLGYGDHNSFFTELLFRSIAVMIAAAILHAPISDLYRIVISPFIMATAGFTEKLTDSVLSDEKGSFYDTVRKELNAPQLNQDDPRKNCMLHCKNMLDENFQYTDRQKELMLSNKNAAADSSGDFIDPQSFSALLCLTCRTYNQMVPFTAIGETMTCYAFAHGPWIPWPLSEVLPVIPDFAYWLMGIGFVIAFSLLMTVVAFYIMDIVLKLAFVIILTPLYVVAWAFPISREYTKKGWDMILYALFEFIGVALMVAIFMVLMMNVLGDLPVNTANIEGAIVSAMKKNDIEALYTLMGGAGPWTLIKLIVVCLMGYKMITASGQVVSALSGISPGIPGVAMAALTGMAKEALSLAGVSAGAAGKVGSQVTKKAAGKISDIAKSRNASKGRFRGGGPTNTRQAAAQGIRGFSAASRQAGSKVGSIGDKLKNRGNALSAAGKEMAARGGIGNKIKGNLMRSGGAVNRLAGKVINPIAKGIGKAMNVAGRGVAAAVDKTGIADKLQKSGDKAQRSKEASLRADPKAAARRERGYNRIQEGMAAIKKNLDVVSGAYLMASGMMSVARSKAQRGLNQMHRAHQKRKGNRKS